MFDVEINHPTFGWIAYTLNPNDTDMTIDNSKLLELIGSDYAAYVAPTQAELDAARQAAQMAIDEPRQALSRFGQGIAGITPGAGTIRLGEAQAAAGASPLMKALGLGLAGADIYGRIF